MGQFFWIPIQFDAWMWGHALVVTPAATRVPIKNLKRLSGSSDAACSIVNDMIELVIAEGMPMEDLSVSSVVFVWNLLSTMDINFNTAVLFGELVSILDVRSSSRDGFFGCSDVILHFYVVGEVVSSQNPSQSEFGNGWVTEHGGCFVFMIKFRLFIEWRFGCRNKWD